MRVDNQGHLLSLQRLSGESDVTVNDQAIATPEADRAHLRHILRFELWHQVVEQFELTTADTVFVVSTIELIALHNNQEAVLLIIMIDYAVYLPGKLFSDPGIDLFIKITHRYDLRFLTLVTEIVDLIVSFAGHPHVG